MGNGDGSHVAQMGLFGLCKDLDDLRDEDVMGGSGYKYQTAGGYYLDEVVSALQKEIRRGKVYESVYWAREMIRSGYCKYLWRRLFVIASEDIGLADPGVVVLAQSLYQNWLVVTQTKSPDKDNADRASLIQIHATMALARALKNREVADANIAAQVRYERQDRLPVPDYAKDQHTAVGRSMGRRGRAGEIYFHQVGRVIHPDTPVDGDPYKKELWKLLKLPVEGLDIEPALSKEDVEGIEAQDDVPDPEEADQKPHPF